MSLANYTFLGMTQSLCPECRALVPAKILVREGRVYFRKRCLEHGVREDFVCSDVAYYDRMEYAVPARIPAVQGIEPERGCPFDCGLCTEHEQHTQSSTSCFRIGECELREVRFEAAPRAHAVPAG
jgi:uncharacterized radical SAM superfamily Fe-S cluster-containing enzyme